MMINRRLIGTVKESKKYIAANVACQWLALVANIALMGAVAAMLQGLWSGTAGRWTVMTTAAVAAAVLTVRFICAVLASRMSFRSAKAVKRTLREMIWRKLLRLGSAYRESVQTSEVVQVAVEGVEQLETYFGAYLPQFFYAMLAPLTLFAVLGVVDLPSATILLICVPLIPVTIAAVQRWAKRLLGKYWGQYTALGDTFLENLQGLTTTKIYGTDGFKHQQMNEQSEVFRKITMKVLTMQLNSISIMDLIAYGGAAVGIILAVTRFSAGQVDLWGCVLIILLAAEFFLPMRMLGSYFHIAMNGMAAAEKIFRLLDLPEEQQGVEKVPADYTIRADKLGFSYTPEKPVLNGVDLVIPGGSFTAIVGESGCGKSTLAAILMGQRRGYTGRLTVGGTELSDLNEDNHLEQFTYIGHQSYIFKGTVRENLCMAVPAAEDRELWAALEQVDLADFLREEQGLDTPLQERGSNFSGGQRQRLALARALLHKSRVYIFDEATANIDVESETIIMNQIFSLAKRGTVILISHRLANVADADNIYVLEQGRVCESGKHGDLLQKNGVYARLWNTQQRLEHYTDGGAL